MNNNIQEDYCSFEVSKLLKEKGFNITSNRGWFMIADDDNGWKKKPSFSNKISPDLIKQMRIEEYDIIYQVTHSLAIKWIRENFGIHIMIEVVGITDSISYTFHTTSLFRPSSDGLAIYHREYGFNSAEEATEAALLYTLQNLIP